MEGGREEEGWGGQEDTDRGDPNVRQKADFAYSHYRGKSEGVS